MWWRETQLAKSLFFIPLRTQLDDCLCLKSVIGTRWIPGSVNRPSLNCEPLFWHFSPPHSAPTDAPYRWWEISYVNRFITSNRLFLSFKTRSLNRQLAKMIHQKTIILVAALATTLVNAWPQHTYKSVSFHPPVLKIEKSGALLADGYIFFAPTPQVSAALMMDDRGELIWSSEVGNFANFETQQLNGESALTSWNVIGLPGFGTASHGYGTVEILNSKYESIYQICPNFNLVSNIANVAGACHRMGRYTSCSTGRR